MTPKSDSATSTSWSSNIVATVPEEIPFRYPENDDTPYLRWFDGQFQSVFVAFNPFLRVPGFGPSEAGSSNPVDYELAAKRCGAACGVSWADIAELCRFPSVRHVNRALRLTGSGRIDPEFADPESTDELLSVCRENSILLPEEGYASPVLELSAGRFLSALGQTRTIRASHFGVDPSWLQSEALSDVGEDVSLVELCTEDSSLFMTIYIDYHYHLICQSDASFAAARPDDYFEGFYADANTTDFWGIGALNASD